MNLPQLAAGALSCVASALVTAAPVHAQGVELVVDAGDPLAPFQDINAALAAALPGDTISVHTGTYAPFFVGTDDLWIRRATPTSVPVIDGAGSVGTNHAIFVLADGVTIEGFELLGFAPGGTPTALASGCTFVQADDATLIDNVAIGCAVGFTIVDGSRPGLLRNVAIGCEGGFSLVDCAGATLKLNSALASTVTGLLSVSSQRSHFVGNRVDGGQNGFLAVADDGSVFDDNLATSCDLGFTIVDLRGCTMRGNVATLNVGHGFGLFFGATSAPASHDNLFQGNTSTGNGGFGFEADPGAVHNKFRGNAASGNALGGANVPWIL